jgi:hypothetical protein
MVDVPGDYDPSTLNHWLWWKLRCHEATPTEFQALFENVMKRVDPAFIQIRPYGNIGDPKSDSLLTDQEAVCLQVVAGARFGLWTRPSLEFEFLLSY